MGSSCYFIRSPVSLREYQQHNDRHERINEIHLDPAMLHPSDPARGPEARIGDGLVDPYPETVPHTEMVLQLLGKGPVCRLRKPAHVLFYAEEKTEDPAQGHGKGRGSVLHPVGHFFKTAIPERHPPDGPGTDMEQKVRYGHHGKDSHEDQGR